MNTNLALQKARVELGERSYDIVFAEKQLNLLGEALRKATPHERVVVMTNGTVGRHYSDVVIESLGRSGFIAEALSIPDGEVYKSFDTLISIYNFLVDYHYTRQTTVVALGGGVVGDIAGFAAATFMRGVDYVQVPTSLLAMVDSSIGGKTGINHPHAKNMIGAFYQPRLVYIDLSTLKTLDKAEFSAGFAEVIKYGVIRDPELFEFCKEQHQAIFRLDGESLFHIIRRSCEIKGEIVSGDEREAGPRSILNFGHTFGHAIEACTNYTQYKHGEAIAIGMVAAARLAAQIGICAPDVAEQIVQLCRMSGLPVRLATPIDPADLLDKMKKDKKVRDNKIRYVLPREIGSVEVCDDVSPHDVRKALETVSRE